MEEKDYLSKREEVISKFRNEFIKGYYNNDTMLNSIIELLTRDENPYIIIERLIIAQKECFHKIVELSENRSVYVIHKPKI